MPGRQRSQPRKQPRQVRALLTRRRILTSAAQVFAEHGYARGTTNRIAERARMSIGSLYQYFPNKDAILAELITAHLDGGMRALRGDGDGDGGGDGDGDGDGDGASGGSSLPAVRALVRSVIANHVVDPRLLRVMFEHHPLPADLLGRIHDQERHYTRYLRGLLERDPAIRVADPATAARLVVTTVELVVHHAIAEPDPIAPATLERELTAMVVRYLTGDRAGSVRRDASAGTGPGPAPATGGPGR